MFLRSLIQSLALVFGLTLALPSSAAVEERTKVALEALSRLKGANLETNPGLKQAVLRVLEQVRGEPEFVTVVHDFNLSGQEQGLADLVVAQPKSPAAVDALRLLLAQKATVSVQALLAGPPERTVDIIKALGQTDDSQTVALLLPLLTDLKNPVAVRRTAVSALTKSNEGATGLLGLAKADQLPEDVKFVAGTELRGVRWPQLRAEAEKLFPAPAAKGDQSLPPLAELVKRTGDPAKGAAIFRRADVGCINCHQVNGEGTDFGPKLSEIGTKLGKEALGEAILDPSAGISFGFETWNVKLKNGDEALGLIVSETEEELSLKAVGGTVTRYPKSTITGREKQALSAMPAGLQQNLTTQDFVDLLEYLASLRQATK